MDDWLYHLILIATGCGAGTINALAGGGPILTLGILSLTGLDPRVANLTSTVALSPGQLAAGFAVKHRLRDARFGHPLIVLFMALVGGALGAALLLVTASRTFGAIVPWLVLIATAIYAVSGVRGVSARTAIFANNWTLAGLLAPLSVYGGYFGGGNSYLVLALLVLSGRDSRLSGEIKNVLIAAINLGAVLVFAASGLVNWPVAGSLAFGGVVGSIIGARLLGRLPAEVIRGIVVIGGLMLTAWMFAR